MTLTLAQPLKQSQSHRDEHLDCKETATWVHQS